jgi:hypothetical protein
MSSSSAVYDPNKQNGFTNKEEYTITKGILQYILKKEGTQFP